MAKCRIQKIKPPCDYQVEGIAKIWLLDYDDFDALRFEGGGLYSGSFVTDVLRRGEWVEIDAPNLTAKYTSSSKYVHTLETFVGSLSAYNISNLHLATKRRYLVLFKTNSGSFHIFGYEAGATLSYAGQTADGLGTLVTITGNSIYPLFETMEGVINRSAVTSVFSPDFNTAYCENE